jgi:hypothetical protein
LENIIKKFKLLEKTEKYQVFPVLKRRCVLPADSKYIEMVGVFRAGGTPGKGRLSQFGTGEKCKNYLKVQEKLIDR